MNNTTKPQAEKIEILSVKVMGWEFHVTVNANGTEHPHWRDKKTHEVMFHDEFNPYEDENHFRQVEEHLMSLQDQSLTFKFLERMTTSHDGTAEGARVYMKATLTQRCDALISVLDSK